MVDFNKLKECIAKIDLLSMQKLNHAFKSFNQKEMYTFTNIIDNDNSSIGTENAVKSILLTRRLYFCKRK